MNKTIPLKSGHKYTIYTIHTASRKPRKREVTFLSSMEEYRYSKITKGTRIGRFYPRGSSTSLTLVIDIEGDLIVAGWGQPDVVQCDPDQLVIEGGFGVPFSLSLQNWNPKFSQYKSLYFLDPTVDTVPTQVFPVQETPKVSIEDFTSLFEHIEATPTPEGDALVLSLPKEHRLKASK